MESLKATRLRHSISLGIIYTSLYKTKIGRAWLE